MVKIYRGKRLEPDNVSVNVHNKPLWHRTRHSPSGLEWGYSGSGPADLALSILWDLLGEEPALSLYMDFKDKFVADWGNEWEITSAEIRRWIQLRIGTKDKPRVINLRVHIVNFIGRLKKEKDHYKMDIRYNLYEKIIGELEILVKKTPETGKEEN